jgi:hypothetical protein
MKRVSLSRVSARRWAVKRGKRVVYVGPFKYAGAVLDRLVSAT